MQVFLNSMSSICCLLVFRVLLNMLLFKSYGNLQFKLFWFKFIPFKIKPSYDEKETNLSLGCVEVLYRVLDNVHSLSFNMNCYVLYD